MALSGAVQSRLLTMVAAWSPVKSRNGSICAWSRPTQVATTSGSFMVRSPDSRGSPISPVAPPTSASGRWPASCRRRAVSTCTRWPKCRLGAVGSKPT